MAFDQLFGQQDFAGPSLLAMMAATGVVLLCRRVGLWPSTTMAVSAVAMLTYLVLIFQASKTFYGLPTWSAVVGLSRAVARAYGHSTVDFAPVPLRPGYAILTVAAMWMVVTLGEVATFRWRRPLLASVGPIALFAFLLVIGTGQGSSTQVVLFLAALFTYWALESSHRLSSWGRWITNRPSRPVQEPASTMGGLARRMGASCVAAALVVPVFLPALEDGLVSWRSDKGGSGFGSGVGVGGSTAAGGAQINPLVDLVPQLITQTEDELFRVQADEAAYWRLLTLNSFDGRRWTDAVADEARAIPTSGAAALDLAPPNPGRILNQEFSISALRGEELPLAGVPLTITAPAEVEGSLFIEPSTADVRLQTQLQEGFTYQVQASVPAVTLNGLRKASVGQPPSGDYLSIPELSPAVQDLAATWTQDAKTDVDALISIQERLRAFDYSIELLDEPTSSDYLEQFLLESKIGYCQQFATAFAVLARHLQIPTRVAVGFLPGDTTLTSPGTFLVTGGDTHAWPEVYFEGYGWVPFEPTPRAESPEPAHTIDNIAPSTVRGAEQILNGGPNGDKRALEQGRNGGPQAEIGPDRARRGPRRRDDSARINTEWQAAFGRIALVLLLMGLVFIGVVPLLKRLRIERRYATATGTRGKAAAAFAEFQQEAEELASPRKGAESASAYARRIAVEATLSRRSADRLATICEAGEFAPSDLPPQLADEAKRLARQLKSGLWSQAGWWRRIRRLWSPLTLLPRRSARLVAFGGKAAFSRILSLGRS